MFLFLGRIVFSHLAEDVNGHLPCSFFFLHHACFLRVAFAVLHYPASFLSKGIVKGGLVALGYLAGCFIGGTPACVFGFLLLSLHFSAWGRSQSGSKHSLFASLQPLTQDPSSLAVWSTGPAVPRPQPGCFPFFAMNLLSSAGSGMRAGHRSSSSMFYQPSCFRIVLTLSPKAPEPPIVSLWGLCAVSKPGCFSLVPQAAQGSAFSGLCFRFAHQSPAPRILTLLSEVIIKLFNQ